MRDGTLEVDVSDVTVRPVTAAEMEGACRLIGLAFAANPSNLAIVRGDRDKSSRMMEQAARAVKLGNRFSHVLGAERQGHIVGVLNAAEWPHCQMTIGEKIKAAPSQIRTMGFALSRAFKVVSARAKHEPRKAHWHVGPIAVHPRQQGHGIGSALLRSFLDEVDQKGAPVFLQADDDRNVVLYERFGFTVVSQEEILGVNTRFLWREAR
jgi:ribosomal protein S18 acetylase RimI-like enzyme